MGQSTYRNTIIPAAVRVSVFRLALCVRSTDTVRFRKVAPTHLTEGQSRRHAQLDREEERVRVAQLRYTDHGPIRALGISRAASGSGTSWVPHGSRYMKSPRHARVSASLWEALEEGARCVLAALDTAVEARTERREGVARQNEGRRIAPTPSGGNQRKAGALQARDRVAHL